MELRVLHVGDLDSLLELYAQLGVPNELPQGRARELWDEIARNPAIRYFGAVDGCRVVATCYCAIIPNLTNRGRPICFVENVVTDERYRKQGLGRAVMELAIAFAREHKCYKVILQSGAQRSGAHAFYRTLGFRDDVKVAFDLRLESSASAPEPPSRP